MRNRDPLFLLTAVLLHAFAVGVVWKRAPSAHTSTETFERAPDERFEFDIDLTNENTKKAIEAPPQPVAHVNTVPSQPGRLVPRGKAIEKNDAPIVEMAPSAIASAETAVVEKPPMASVPGLDGKPIWALPGILPPAPAPTSAGAIAAGPAPVIPGAPPASTGPLAVALDYLASGNPPKANATIAPVLHFPAAGTLASALASEVRSSSTPPNSDGIFELVVNAKGQLISVQVVAADPRNRQEWDRVAQAIAQRFSGQTFPLPDAYAQGSRIRVAVQSRMTMPDGTAHGVPVPLPKIPGLPSERDIRIETMDDPHRAGGPASGLPPTQLAAGLSFDMDLANIGAKRRRIVHTRISAAPLARATTQGAAAPQR